MTSPVKTKVFITVMTYPHPSRFYQELVCTAGITESGEWVRLYPIDYRYRERHQQFKKYQWIEVELWPFGAGNDNRKESKRPVLETIRLLGPPVAPRDKWRARREIIDRVPHYTRNQLHALRMNDGRTSLGIVRPSQVLDLKIKKAARKWKAEWQKLYDQDPLFGPKQKPLQKIPFTFHYIFKCEDSGRKSHTAMCEDWELGMLFINALERLGSENAAAQSVRDKYLGELCRSDKDTRFFMGTLFPYHSWLVLGVFWPPKDEQSLLF